MNTKIFRHIATAALALATLTACEIESHSSKLDGFWHLEQIDTLATGGIMDVSNEKLFWALQTKLLEVSDKATTSKIFFSFHHSDGTLFLFGPHYLNRPNGDPVVEDPSILAPFGINALEETFDVETLTGSKMTLKSQTLRLKFKKF